MKSSDKRKAQVVRAKNKYRFNKMIDSKADKGIKFSLPKEDLIELFCNQEENDRVTGSVFLKKYIVVDPDTQKERPDIPNDTQVCKPDAQESSADSLLCEPDSPNYAIPLKTSQHELIQLIVNFFKAKAVAPDDIKRTVNRLMDFYPHIAVYHNVTCEEDLSKVIRKFIDETKPDILSIPGVAEAVLNGLTMSNEGFTNDNVGELLTIMYRNHTASTDTGGE